MRLIKTVAVVSFIAIFFSPLHALDIPLSGAAETGKGGASLGYVDMDRIFQIFPQTQAAKEDYAKQLTKKKEQLAAKEAEISEVKNRISVLESTIKAGGTLPPSDGTSADSSSPAVPEVPGSQGLEKMQQDFETRKVELEELRKQAASDLATFQNQQSQLILGKIYQALRDVAIEEQVSVVVDKSSILYGDATIDLTEKLQQRVRGY